MDALELTGKSWAQAKNMMPPDHKAKGVHIRTLDLYTMEYTMNRHQIFTYLYTQIYTHSHAYVLSAMKCKGKRGHWEKTYIHYISGTVLHHYMVKKRQ